MTYKFQNTDNRNLITEKTKKQLEEFALRNISKEINDSLQFCFLSNFVTSVAVTNPAILPILEEGFKSAVETLKKQKDPIGIGDIENIKKIIDVEKTIDECAEPYKLIIQTIKKIIEESNVKES